MSDAVQLLASTLPTASSPTEVEISYLLGRIDPNMRLAFRIDRMAPSCKTPRRNAEVNEAHSQLAALHKWAQAVRKIGWAQLCSHQHLLQPHVLGDTPVDTQLLGSKGLFVPVIPVFDTAVGLDTECGTAKATALLPLSDANALLAAGK